MEKIPAKVKLPTLEILRIFFGALSRRKKFQFVILIALSILCAVAELVSIGAIAPFILALTKPEIPFSYANSLNISAALNILDVRDIVLPITIGFIALILFSTILRVAVLYGGTKFAFSVGSEISSACYRAYLYKPYDELINDHTSDIINDIFINVNLVIYQVIQPLTVFFTALSLILSITILMIAINPIGSIIAITFLFIFYTLVYFFNKKRTIENGVKIDLEVSRVIKAINDGIGGIRDIILGGTQKTFLDIHANADSNLRKLQGESLFISAFPRVGIEAVAMILIAIAGYLIARDAGMEVALPTLAIVVMAGQRLLPSLQQCYHSINSINSSSTALNKINNLLLKTKTNDLCINNLCFNESIKIKKVGLRLGASENLVLNQVDLEISKGEIIGLIGKTGSGKSSLADIVMGLLFPTSGVVEIDSTVLSAHNINAWRAMVAHVPQSIFLANDSIANNIAFGVPHDEIDQDRLIRAIKYAQLTELVESLNGGTNAKIGERGAFLSGGQRQRIGIARALYKDSKILIFDEATSALDSETEMDIMNCIYSLGSNLTILIVAHRLSTLIGCNRIVELESGRVRAIGSYKDLIINERG
jgi:ABC-type multidrug transport system fused ATPase/permease subunit